MAPRAARSARSGKSSSGFSRNEENGASAAQRVQALADLLASLRRVVQLKIPLEHLAGLHAVARSLVREPEVIRRERVLGIQLEAASQRGNRWFELSTLEVHPAERVVDFRLIL